MSNTLLQKKGEINKKKNIFTQSVKECCPEKYIVISVHFNLFKIYFSRQHTRIILSAATAGFPAIEKNL